MRSVNTYTSDPRETRAGAGIVGHAGPRATYRAALAITLRAALVLALCGGAIATAQEVEPDEPDAVIELWEQRWTLHDDGSREFHERRHVRLNHSRVFTQFGDVRIPYHAQLEKVQPIVARTKRPDGVYVETPDYSYITVSPGGPAGWPAFADRREHVIVFSGIEPGCVVELEYVVRSEKGEPVFSRDLSIDASYPILARSISVDVGPRVTLTPAISGIADDRFEYILNASSDGAGHTWMFVNLPAALSEPSSRPWQESRPRLSFTTAPAPADWLSGRIAQIETAADESPLIARLAQDWTKDAKTPGERIASIRKSLGATTHAVSFDVNLRPAPRRASQTIDSGYGLPDELAAGFLALLRSADLGPARIGALVRNNTWNDIAPQEAMIDSWVVVAGDGPQAEIWHPTRGRVGRNQEWAGADLLTAGPQGIERRPLAPWTNADESGVNCAGDLRVSNEGRVSGRLAFRTSGLFADNLSLDSRDAQSSRVNELVRRVAPGMKVKDFSVTALAPNVFDFNANVESSESLDKVGDAFRLALAENGPLLAEVRLPLSGSQRRLPIRCAGAAHETLDLTIRVPAEWRLDVTPAALPATNGAWGKVEQTVETSDGAIRIRREIRLESRDISADDALKLRAALRPLRSEATRTLLARE